jgi:cytochrome c
VTRALRIAVLAGALACGRAQAPLPETGGDAELGRAWIQELRCGVCHQIPGVRGARGIVGPSLDGFGRRPLIAGQLANTPGNLVAWLQNPPALQPGTAMPEVGLDAGKARDVAAFLYRLR